ncbi:P450-derived glycosyltransferase activator [Natronosporangium hydrolyticum]|uniref:P450-derived glycosyltransferase activator n=1 Tax=Natronosporangium hydrolyticum TaxID=2811111 RepID=A0A895YKK1_9ACTN|nr:P450-derived glycosyltransferase activator [Natronosporangium hydrolyticum]QSB16029.1 P450-derived glycosyltransferase activator [Natronosporangium hydrolyticum]
MTRHQIDPRQVRDSDLSRHLLAARGMQWMRGNRGDPYALLLRAQGVDPHMLFRGMRGDPRLRQSEVDVWVTTDLSVGTTILTDPRFSVVDQASARRRKRPFSIDAQTTLKHVLTIDECLARERPELERLTAVATPAFGTAALVDRRSTAMKRCQELVDAAGHEFDLARDVVGPLVTGFLAELLGVPNEQRARFVARCDEVSGAQDALLCPPTLAGARRLTTALDDLQALVDDLVAARQQTFDGDDALAELSRLPNGSDSRSDDARTIALLTTIVGVEVTVTAICDAVLTTVAHPDHWRRLHSDPDYAGAVVEESLRYEPPVRMESRLAAEGLEILGQPVRKGDQLVVLVDAANRDPEVFEDPEQFDPDRTSRRHLSLADGTNSGFVAPFTRLLATVGLSVLAQAAPALRPAGDVVRRMRSPVVRGVARCPVAK